MFNHIALHVSPRKTYDDCSYRNSLYVLSPRAFSATPASRIPSACIHLGGPKKR
jgi:hypothetical protein